VCPLQDKLIPKLRLRTDSAFRFANLRFLEELNGINLERHRRMLIEGRGSYSERYLPHKALTFSHCQARKCCPHSSNPNLSSLITLFIWPGLASCPPRKLFRRSLHHLRWHLLDYRSPADLNRGSFIMVILAII
jgi:hypothetical protein